MKKAREGMEALTPSGTRPDTQAQRDARDLARLGYAQELLRSMGGFSNFAISFSIISILTGAVTLFDYGLQMGGPLEMVLGWPLASLGTLFVALSMAELCSALPTSGGTYHWSAELGGATWAWFTALLNIVGLLAALAAIDYGCAQFLTPILGLGASTRVVLEAYAVILASHGIINHVGIRWVAWLNDLSVSVHILGVLVLIGALWIFAPKQPLRFLLTPSTSSTIHAPYAWLFMLGLLQAAWTYTGYDASAHVAEETLDPRRQAPWGIVLSVVVSGFFGYLLVLSLAWVIPSISGVLSAKDGAGNPLPAVLAIVTSTLGQRAGKALLMLAVAAMWFCGLSTVTSVSRVIYSLARDKGLPLARLWSRTHSQHKTPGPAIWLSVGVAFLALAYNASYSVVTSLSVLGCYIAYGIPVYLGWRRKRDWVDKRGPWHLGGYSNAVNLLALGWTVVICAIMVMPPNTVAGISMAMVIALLYSFHRFTGPHEIRKPTWAADEGPITPNS
jgi:amino acid transporter